MLNKKTIIIFIVLLIIILTSILFVFKPDRWKKYYQDKLNQPPREFVINALSLIPKTSKLRYALDLGSGVGHETLLLLKDKFNVIAIDSAKSAFTIMLARPAFKEYLSNLKTINTNFEKLDFNNIPELDVIVASYSLPFIKAEYFDFVFSNIIDKLKPHGYFIGNFFDPGFNVFKESDRKNMTFHKKGQISELFKNFKIISFKEIKTPGKENNTTNHTYEIFAQKLF